MDINITPEIKKYLSHHGIKGQKWGVRRFQNKDGSLTDAGEKRYNGKYDIPKGTIMYRADSDPTMKFMGRDYTYVNVTGNLKKHIENVGGDTDNYKLKTTRSLKIASTTDYFNAVMEANRIKPDKFLSDVPDEVIDKGKYAIENILSSSLLEGWGGKNKSFNRAAKYLNRTDYSRKPNSHRKIFTVIRLVVLQIIHMFPESLMNIRIISVKVGW